MSRTSSRGAHRSGRNYRHRHLKKFKLTFTYKVRTSRHPYKRFDDMKSVYDMMIDKKDFYSETKIGYFFTKCFTDVDGKDLSTELADPGAHFLAFHDSVLLFRNDKYDWETFVLKWLERYDYYIWAQSQNRDITNDRYARTRDIRHVDDYARFYDDMMEHTVESSTATDDEGNTIDVIDTAHTALYTQTQGVDFYMYDQNEEEYEDKTVILKPDARCREIEDLKAREFITTLTSLDGDFHQAMIKCNDVTFAMHEKWIADIPLYREILDDMERRHNKMAENALLQLIAKGNVPATLAYLKAKVPEYANISANHDNIASRSGTNKMRKGFGGILNEANLTDEADV